MPIGLVAVKANLTDLMLSQYVTATVLLFEDLSPKFLF